MSEPCINMADQLWTLPAVIKCWAELEPNREVFIFINKHGRHSALTARDVYILAGRFASRLIGCGFTSGDVIANGLPNSPERVVTDFGIAMAGCITLNCQVVEKDGGTFWDTAKMSLCKGAIFPDQANNPAYQLFAPFILGNSQGVAGFRDIAVPQAPLVTKGFLIIRDNIDCYEGEKSQEETSDPPDNHNASVSSASASKKNGEENFLTSLLKGNNDILAADCSPHDVVYIFTTSGSTGPCKLVPRTHEELLRMSRGHRDTVVTYYFNDRQLSWLGGFPFDYFGMCRPRVLQDVLGGQHALNVSDIWWLLQREKCAAAGLAPSDILDLVQHFEGLSPEFKLKYIVTAGLPLRKNVMAALGTVTDVIINMYASTETGLMTMMVVKDASEFMDCACGRPIEGVQIRVVDEQIQDVPPGVEGNILVKSKNMFTNYYNFTPAQPIFINDGWFMIGDRGWINEQGILTVTCRQGDVVSQGVILIYLSWPETVLYRCPDVMEVSVVSVQDSDGVDKICVCVVPRKDSGLTQERLVKFYDDSFMSSLSTSILKPQISCWVFYEELPLTTTGKIDKQKLKNDALRMINEKVR